MKQNRQSKIVAILALCVSVVGLTLGFAAFSNTLTISSSATVSPNESDFKLVIYGAEDASKLGDVDKTCTSLTQSEPVSSPAGDAKVAVIDNDTLTISNLDVTFKKPGDYFGYYFKVKNEGKYDAYITKSDFEEISRMVANKTCVGAVGTTETMVQGACDFVKVTADLYDFSNYGYLHSNNLEASDDYIEIPVGGYAQLIIEFYYEGTNVVRADGDFDVNFSDIKLNFSTVNPSESQ